jgi:hypothetical protein
MAKIHRILSYGRQLPTSTETIVLFSASDSGGCDVLENRLGGMYFIVVYCFQPLIVEATTCWRIDWEELEDNTATFHALCQELRHKVTTIMSEHHDDDDNDDDY